MLCLKDNILDVIINSSWSNRGQVQITGTQRKKVHWVSTVWNKQFSFCLLLISETHNTKICPNLMKILLYPLCMEHKLSWWEQQKLPVQGLSFKLHVVHSLQAFKKLVLEKSKLLISLLSEDLQPGRCPAGCRYVVKNGLKIHLPASLSPSLCPPEWCVTQHCHNCSHQL